MGVVDFGDLLEGPEGNIQDGAVVDGKNFSRVSHPSCFFHGAKINYKGGMVCSRDKVLLSINND